MSPKELFKEICNGYGFYEVEQQEGGIYCTGCNQVHKRPTKLYSNGRDVLCREQVIYLYPLEGNQ